MYAALIVFVAVVAWYFLTRARKKGRAVKINLKFGKPQDR